MSAVLEIEQLPQTQKCDAQQPYAAATSVEACQPLFPQWAVAALAALRLDARQS